MGYGLPAPFFTRFLVSQQIQAASLGRRASHNPRILPRAGLGTGMSRPGSLPLVSARVRDRVVIALNRGLSFELQNRHLWLHSYEFGGENDCRRDHC